MVAGTCLVEAAVEVEIHGASHNPGDVGALRPARAEVVEGLGDEGLMCVGGEVLSHHGCTLDSNRSYLAVRRTSVSVTPVWAPPVRDVCAEAEAASASRLVLEGKDGRLLTPAEVAAAAAASSCSRSLYVMCMCSYQQVHMIGIHLMNRATHPSAIRCPWNACRAATAACAPRSTTPASHPARNSMCGADATAPASLVDAVVVVVVRDGRGKERLKRAEYQKRFQNRSGQSSSIVSR